MNNDSKEVTAKSYTLRTEQGNWLGQIVLTSDGAFMAITDYGNFNFAWRAYGKEDFREFICRLDVHYFAGKIANGMYYVTGVSRKIDKVAQLFTEKILPTLQEVLKKELADELSNDSSHTNPER